MRFSYTGSILPLCSRQHWVTIFRLQLPQAAKMSTTYNIVTIVVALALVPLALKFGGKKIYAASLLGTGLALLTIPYISDPLLVLLPMVLFGIGWAAMMGIPYTMVSKIVPQDRRGVYMGILNMMIGYSYGNRNSFLRFYL